MFGAPPSGILGARVIRSCAEEGLFEHVRVLGLILAGGRARRFGSDKALALLGGKPLVTHVAARARGQVDTLALNAAADTAGTGLLLLPDHAVGEGPLSGWLAGLRYAETHGFDHLATFACDTPFFPENTVARLCQALEQADCAVPQCGGQIHRTFALVRTASRQRVEEAFASGVRAVKALGTVLRCGYADFSNRTDGPGGDAFFNINQPEDLLTAERWLAERDA